jgi:2-oxoglutarate dehydrogenase E1 component
MAAPSDLSATFLSGANAPFIAELYERYIQDPGAVDPSWGHFFAELRDEPPAVANDWGGPSWARRNGRIIGGDGLAAADRPTTAEAPTDRRATIDSIRALMLIRAYRVRGHLLANLDPLGLNPPEPHPELEPSSYGFEEGDLDRPVFIDGVLGLKSASMREILAIVRATYCGTIGVEFMHIGDPAQKAWIQQRIEGPRNHTDFTPRGKRAILERLTAAETFERFLNVKYTGTKRFGLDGGESLIPALEQIIKRGSQLGLREIVIGMPHRGRLNVLANFMGKPFSAIFSEFQGNAATPDDVQGSGDVKYHLGTSSDRQFDDASVHLTLNANPSHLEAVDPVVIGRVRAKQVQQQDSDRTKVMALLMHGDAAFAGQGLVAETFDFSGLRGYRTGGTIHFIVNNQIGFTTAPHFSRSSPYPSDVAKMVQAPIFHVNGDDPEAVVHVARVAVEFRQQFHSDVVIDMFCYRRHGHNEGDEPAFTQPLMYRRSPSTRPLARSTPSSWPTRASSRKPRASRWSATSRPTWKPTTRRPTPTSRTRPTGSKAPGAASKSPRARSGAAKPRSRWKRCARSARHSAATPRASTPIPRSCASSRTSRRPSRPVRGSTGRPPRRSPSARSWSRATVCASPARTAAAARSRIAIPCWSTR